MDTDSKYVPFGHKLRYRVNMTKRRLVRLPPEIWDEQAKRYGQSITCPIIAKETGASVQTVWKQLRESGIRIMSSKDWGQLKTEYRREALKTGQKKCRKCGLIFALG